MKKFGNYVFMIIASFILFVGDVFAYGFDATITGNSVTVGNSITLRITSNGIAGRFNVSSSNTSVASLSTSSVWSENDTQTITIYAKKAGKARIIITPNSVTTSDDNPKDVQLNEKELEITVNAPYVAPPRQLSSNSYLSNLSVEGFELKETFSKETLEYTIDIPAETEKIKINAQLADSSAKVTGIGEINVSEGINNLSIVVTAENGSKRTYILKATVLELEPIKVVIDGKEYIVVRKKKDLPEVSEFFSETEIDIDNKKIPGYLNEKLGYTLVGLKNDNGDIEMYIYKNNKYSLYREYTFNGTVLQVLDKEINNNYKKTSFVYDSNKIDSYQEVKLDILKNTYALDDNDISGNQFFLFYAINVETGKEAIYQYDAAEKTVQRYNTLILDMYKERSDKYYLYLLGSILILGIVIITFSTILICKKKKRSNR